MVDVNMLLCLLLLSLLRKPNENLHTCGPEPPNTALPRICINTSLIVVALWLACYINPSHSDYSGTWRLLLLMLQSNTTLTPPWMVTLIGRLLPTTALIQPVPGPNPKSPPHSCSLVTSLFPDFTLSTGCSSALPAAPCAVLFPTFIPMCCC
jgi:hypothetical protein